MSTTRIIIMAKAPVAGFAKTRLIPALGAEGAARLAERMLHHAVGAALGAGVGPVELCATPAPQHPAWHSWRLRGLEWSDQGQGDLGARMGRAAQRSLARGERILLMGTDCPELDAARLQQSAHMLESHQAVMQPTFDGGYALLGLQRFDPQVFREIAWSTDCVARETGRRMAALGWTVHVSAPLHDIDTADDLRWLPDAWPERPRGSKVPVG